MGSFRDLLEEIPVTIRNPGIVSALLFDMQVRRCVTTIRPSNRVTQLSLPYLKTHS